jgi:hypothetical protein
MNASSAVHSCLRCKGVRLRYPSRPGEQFVLTFARTTEVHWASHTGKTRNTGRCINEYEIKTFCNRVSTYEVDSSD